MKDHQLVYDQLVQITGPANIIIDQPLKEYTYTKLGGTADFFVTPETYEQVKEVVKFAKVENIAFTLLGNGSNLIIKDGGIRGIVMNLVKLGKIEIIDNKVVAQTGAKIIDVSRIALTGHLAGIEFACGIPGSVGGALFMNAGAYGGEIKDVLESAVVVSQSGELFNLKAEELDFSYRMSNLQKNGHIVLEATFVLKKGNNEEIKAIMEDLTCKRESKQPLEYPSCGSVFKRPPGQFAGKLIQDSGLQGEQIGGAQVSLKHAGFIVNKEGASSNDYIALIEYVQKTVKEKFDVALEREVRIIGEDVGV